MMNVCTSTNKRLFIASLLSLSPSHPLFAELDLVDAESPWSLTGIGGISKLTPQEDGGALVVSNDLAPSYSLTVDYLWGDHFLLSGFYEDSGSAQISNSRGVVGDLNYRHYGGDMTWFPFSARNTISPYFKVGLHQTATTANSDQIFDTGDNQIRGHAGAGFTWKWARDWRLVVDLTSYSRTAYRAGIGVRHQLFSSPVVPAQESGRRPPTAAKRPVVPEPVDIPMFTLIPEPIPGAEAPMMAALDDAPLAEGAQASESDQCRVIEVDLSRSTVPFKYNSSRLSKVGKKVWRTIAEQLLKYPEVVLELAGHTDNIGSRAYNQKISLRRANSVKRFLIAAGVAEKQLRIKGYGEMQPIASNATREGRSLNRRVEAHIISQPRCDQQADGYGRQAITRHTVAADDSVSPKLMDDELIFGQMDNSESLSQQQLAGFSRSVTEPAKLRLFGLNGHRSGSTALVMVNNQLSPIPLFEKASESSVSALPSTGTVAAHFDSYDFQSLHPASRRELKQMAKQLQKNPVWQLEVAGHSDADGNAELNHQLAQLRAERVADYLLELGVGVERMRVQGYADTQPMADNATAEGRRLNRRVEVRLG